MSARRAAAERVLRPCRKTPPRWYRRISSCSTPGLSTSVPIMRSWPARCSGDIRPTIASSQLAGTAALALALGLALGLELVLGLRLGAGAAAGTCSSPEQAL